MIMSLKGTVKLISIDPSKEIEWNVLCLNKYELDINIYFFNTDFLVGDSLECDLHVTETMEKLSNNKHISSQIKVSKVLV